ncbi:MAG: penicillin-binding transpeptidase domain-containing protein [Wolbachia endosymbiont of Tyrophagus putrescentiae]|nr:penicillin-binding transpeptidase domain-containing protein [Wolbachia endosymbiont of Tyrophagus putrescentiae]
MKKNKTFTRRAFILGGIQLVISAIFSYRLYTLQIRDREKYEVLSNNNRIRIANILPYRGRILDRNSVELAVTEVSSAFYRRHYPFGSICSHVLGYTNRKQIGVSGAEYIYDRELKGTPGKVEQEVNSRKKVIRELSSTPPQNGDDIQLTIDINLQQKVAEIFQKYQGSVVVIDTRNGEILALYNSPAYDNNVFTGTLSNDVWSDLNSPSLPLVNRALSYQIPLGSVFKTVVALAALKDGIITPQDRFLCKGHMTIGNRKFRCRKSDGHGYLSLNEAIAASCNTYFYNIGKQISVDSLVKMASEFGIGSGALIKKFKEEAPGLLPDRDWREQNLYSEWQLGDTINLTIGQGYILATPLQLAVLAARLATGKKVMPYIDIQEAAQTFSDIDIDHKHLSAVQNAMFNTVNSRIGTAYTTNLPKGIHISGKTGTPEINSRGKSHKAFIAFSSSHHAVSVFIEHGKIPRQDFLIAYKIFDYIAKKKFNF